MIPSDVETPVLEGLLGLLFLERIYTCWRVRVLPLSPVHGAASVLFCKEQTLWIPHFCNCQSQFCAKSKLLSLGRRVGKPCIPIYDFLYVTLFWAWSDNLQLWLSFLPCGYGAEDKQTTELSLQSFSWSFTARSRCCFLSRTAGFYRQTELR